MARKPLKGVGGVLGSLISPEADVTSPEPPPEPTQTEPLHRPEATAPGGKPRTHTQPRPQARRGRPPGKKAGEGGDKEKVTLRLNKELMDEYRDWSWDERCQLGELVERALNQYRQRRRQKSQ